MIKISIICFLLVSCATVDIEKDILSSAGEMGSNITKIDPVLIYPESEYRTRVVQIEKPIFIPEKEASQAAAPKPAAAGEVRDVINQSFIRPQEFSHAAVIYDYNPNWVYEVYCQILRVSDIHLEPGERVTEVPFVSDSDRWIIGAGVSYDNGVAVQHIYLKPAEASIEATLIINTDRRVYHIILRSYTNVHMPIVRFRYLSLSSGLPNNYLSSPLSANHVPETDITNPPLNINPKYLSFNYRMTYPLFNKPVWLPELVFDDGSKTYIRFPELVFHREMPSVFENRKDILNYRVMDNVIVIDKLIENITVKIGSTEVTISKKRGANVR